MSEGIVAQPGHSGEALYNILTAALSKKEEGWLGESPVLAQRAASEEREGSSQTILCARRTRTMKRCSFDARSEGQSVCSLWGNWGIGRPSLDARSRGSLETALPKERKTGSV